MQTYKPRKIAFKEVIEINNWQIKVYTIAKNKDFNHPIFYENVKAKLPNWLTLKNGFDDSNNKLGFLILHSGTEGIFSLINWWVGSNMLNTNIFITKPETPNTFTKISGSGLAPCIWELAVINHERIALTNHVLKQENEANLKAYLNDFYEATI